MEVMQQEHETVVHMYQQSGSRGQRGNGDRLLHFNVYLSNLHSPVRPQLLKIPEAFKIALGTPIGEIFHIQTITGHILGDKTFLEYLEV